MPKLITAQLTWAQPAPIRLGGDDPGQSWDEITITAHRVGGSRSWYYEIRTDRWFIDSPQEVKNLFNELDRVTSGAE